MRECFIPYKPHGKTLQLIHLANEIIEGLLAGGYTVTLRQLYYQLVRRNVIENKDSEYKRLGEILNDARLGGLVDWNAIVDRTRFLRGINHYGNPNEVVSIAAGSFRMDRWKNQTYRPEVWVEKDAIVQIVQKACEPLDVDYFSCRGYTSQSGLHGASQRLLGYMEAGQTPLIIHLGDHDPSGIDMSRDIFDRLELFTENRGFDTPQVRRVALNMKQIVKYAPPPNPAKQTDSRYDGYKRKHGKDSWELDALDPEVIDNLITENIKGLIDQREWDESVAEEQKHRSLLSDCAKRWPEVQKFLEKPPKPPRKPRKKAKKKK